MDEQIHQTMGQELLYLLLIVFVSSTLVLAVMLLQRNAGGVGETDQPPIITLSEAQGYSFTSGSTELSPQFLKQLHGSIADQLVRTVQIYHVNVIEIVGHTDQAHVKARHGSLDDSLIPYLAGEGGALGFADNAGLGMARAAVVMRELKQDQRLANIKFIPLSGAHATPPDGEESADGARMRRVEIRLRR